MNRDFPALARGVASVIVGVSLAACSGSGAPPGSSILPQSSNGHALASSTAVSSTEGGIRIGITRIAKSDATAARARAMAQNYTHPSNTTTADPPVPRPNEQPCTVTLFTNFQFTSFTYPTFHYSPPAACPGPWAKVVFEGDFSVNAGRQFDRTGSVWIAGTNVYFGTTAEPSANEGPHWHVERDITDLTPILQTASTGEVVLGNIVNSTYTSIITASGTLQFYPASKQYSAANVPDDVYPLSGGPLGDNQYITTQAQPLTGTFTLPRNVRAAYLDVYLQSQIGDEFWYTCFPNDLAQEIPNCGNTAFREGDVAIDGQPAGVVPVYPWIYTGGIDPYLWRPIPGVETLEFKPYRVDLTPFAGILSNGSSHTVTVNVFNNGNYFAANGTLLVYLDHGSSQVTGGIIRDDTVLYPSPVVSENVHFNSSGVGSGPVSVTSSHRVFVDGYVNTSQGRVETQVHQQITFSNDQQVTGNASGSLFDQNIKQLTTVESVTTTFSHQGNSVVTRQEYWPLDVVYDFTANADGSATQNASVHQTKVERILSVGLPGDPFRSYLSDSVNSSDILTFPASGSPPYIPSNGKSTQTYTANDSTGYCYSKTISSLNYILTGQSGGSCSGF
jgi:hypothetical protein